MPVDGALEGAAPSPAFRFFTAPASPAPTTTTITTITAGMFPPTALTDA